MQCKKFLFLALGIGVSIYVLLSSAAVAKTNPPFIIIAVFSFTCLIFCIIQFLLCEQLHHTYKKYIHSRFTK